MYFRIEYNLINDSIPTLKQKLQDDTLTKVVRAQIKTALALREYDFTKQVGNLVETLEEAYSDGCILAEFNLGVLNTEWHDYTKAQECFKRVVKDGEIRGYEGLGFLAFRIDRDLVKAAISFFHCKSYIDVETVMLEMSKDQLFDRESQFWRYCLDLNPEETNKLPSILKIYIRMVKLEHENSILRNMIEYDPDGPQFETIKEHFEALQSEFVV